MGLEERKAIEAFKRDRLPQLEQFILEAAGFKVELEIDWEAIAAQGIRNRFLEIWQSIDFSPLIEALKAVNTDEPVAQALRSNLKKVAVVCTGQATLSTGSYEPDFKDGMLTIDDRLCNYDDVKTRAERIQKLLEVVLEIAPPKTPQERVAEEMAKLESVGVADVFLALQRLKHRSRGTAAMPRLTLSLHSGNTVEGYLLDFRLGTQGTQRCVLMMNQRDGKLTYVRLDGIDAVAVHTASAFSVSYLDENALVEAKGEVVKALAFGRLKINPAKIPGKMQVVRRASDLAQTLTDKLGKELKLDVPWEELPKTEAMTVGVSLILDGIQNVMEQYLTDEVASEAIKEKIKTIRIVIGEQKQVILKDGLLSVCVQITEGNIDFLAEENLREMMNNVL